MAGEAGKLVVVDLSLASRAQFDHFAGAGKMMLWRIS